MPTPFPGMDPYLEAEESWRDVQLSLTVKLTETITARLRPRYVVRLKERHYVQVESPWAFRKEPFLPTAEESTKPIRVILPIPEEMKEIYLEVTSIPDHVVVTTIEILSPANKQTGKGRDLYLRRRERLLCGISNLVEIDLQRIGQPMPILDEIPKSDYRILVHRRHQRPWADLYVFSVRDPIPVFPLPLQQDEDEPLIDLNPILHQLYDLAGYDLRIDYRRDPDPPLTNADAAWADALLHTSGHRP